MNNEWIEGLYRRYVTKGVLIDTNLLLLFLVGSVDRNLIERFERTSEYDKELYRILAEFLSRFDTFVTTPHVMTEVSNLTHRKLKGEMRTRFYQFYCGFAVNACEIYKASSEIAKVRELLWMGITDTVILDQAVGKYLLLTDDIELKDAFETRGGDALSISNLLEASW